MLEMPVGGMCVYNIILDPVNENTVGNSWVSALPLSNWVETAACIISSHCGLSAGAKRASFSEFILSLMSYTEPF